MLAATGLVGLAAILVTVVFTFDGAPQAGRDGGQRATAPDVTGSTRPSAAALIDASTGLQDRIDRTLRRERATALRERELARKKDRQRRAHAAPRSAPVTTEVVASPPPAPEPARDPWPGVSRAEREFTPGPWNLS